MSLYEMRSLAGLTQQEIAEQANLTVPSYRKAEKGLPVSLGTANLIAAFFQKEIDDIEDLKVSERRYVRSKAKKARKA